MRDLLVWPNGDWAYRDEVWQPEPDFVTVRIPDYWTDDRVTRYVQHLLESGNDNRTPG